MDTGIYFILLEWADFRKVSFSIFKIFFTPIKPYYQFEYFFQIPYLTKIFRSMLMERKEDIPDIQLSPTEWKKAQEIWKHYTKISKFFKKYSSALQKRRRNGRGFKISVVPELIFCKYN